MVGHCLDGTRAIVGGWGKGAERNVRLCAYVIMYIFRCVCLVSACVCVSCVYVCFYCLYCVIVHSIPRGLVNSCQRESSKSASDAIAKGAVWNTLEEKDCGEVVVGLYVRENKKDLDSFHLKT